MPVARGIRAELEQQGYVKGTPEYRKAYGRAYYHAVDQKPRNLKRNTYGLNEGQLCDLYAKGKCDCCGTPVKPRGEGHPKREVGNVDHDHVTGKVRGILCNPCNQALGLLRDRPELAVAYLERTR